MPNLPALSCTDLTFAWPDGDVVLSGLTATFPTGRTGLIGVNGSGKSTLLRLAAGDLTPSSGAVVARGSVAYLPQELTMSVDATVADVLGVAERLQALETLTAGSAAEPDVAVLLDLVQDAWDLPERTAETLDRLGLRGLGLSRRVGELSGGQVVLLGVGARVLARPDILLLDEPTNNLDRQARARVHDVVSTWPGSLIVVSHDRELLDRVDAIADLHDGRVSTYGGGFTAYEQARAIEKEAAERSLRTAEADLRRQKRDLIEARVKLDTRRAMGRKAAANLVAAPIVMQQRKRDAQVSAGKLADVHLDRIASARARVEEAASSVRDEDVIRVDLPGTAVPSGRVVLRLDGVVLAHGTAEPVDLEMRGPERIALTGGNGVGKTTLLDTIAGRTSCASGVVQVPVPVGYLPQRLDVLDDSLSVVDAVAAHAPDRRPHDIRVALARVLFRGREADRPAGSLSGGERLRASLVAVLMAQPPPQLLLLDEPTNNLDLVSVAQLRTALASYRGALIVASHDELFLRDLDLDRRLELG